MKRTCRNRITSCIMMGLLVVGLTVWFALPARAVPIDYTLNGGSAVGGFTLDDTLADPYTAWTISIFGHVYDNVTDTFITLNFSPVFGTFYLQTQNSDPSILNLNIIFPNTYQIQVSTTGGTLSDEGSFARKSQSVPEAPPGVLSLIGLLVLASARWWTHRQERLQLG